MYLISLGFPYRCEETLLLASGEELVLSGWSKLVFPIED